MTKVKMTKKALVASIIALIVILSTLTGTTFAWFTDTETSGGNKIVAGNLDIDLLMLNADGVYDSIGDSDAPIFGGEDSIIAQNNNIDTLWEPGKTQVAYLQIANEGNLAAKYKVSLNVSDVKKNLHEVMEFAIVRDADSIDDIDYDTLQFFPVDLGVQAVSDEAIELPVNAKHNFALVVRMLESATNNYKKGEITFDIIVNAAQLNAEEDAFDANYDVDATYDTLPAASETTVATETTVAPEESN